MRLMETNSKEWKQARADLLHRVHKYDGWIRSVMNGTPYHMQLQGGRLLYTYDFEERKLSVHGKASRSAGGKMSVGTLKKLESTIQEWQETIESEETN
ncbi:hypothetical protein ER45_030355 (plasmid) [Bacillus mycoides]|nr:hypothetical protein ER45_030355 [Bacillus mycoides]